MELFSKAAQLFSNIPGSSYFGFGSDSNAAEQTEKQEKGILDSIIDKACKVKEVLLSISNKLQKDGFLGDDSISNIPGANYFINNIVDYIGKNYSLVDESEVGYKLTIDNILDELLNIVDGRDLVNNEATIKEKLTRLTSVAKQAKKEVEEVSPALRFIFEALTGLIKTIAKMFGVIFDESKDMSNEKAGCKL